jgi:hypothetical protein
MLEIHQPRYGPRARWALYLASAFVSAPSSGLIIWAILHRRGDAESRALGRRCGIISLTAGACGFAILLLRRAARRRRLRSA